MIPARDGIHLATDIYRPQVNGAPAADRLTHDKDTEVASEAIRASRAIRARVALPAPAPAPTPATAQKP